jgi:hypothetical protein
VCNSVVWEDGRARGPPRAPLVSDLRGLSTGLIGDRSWQPVERPAWTTWRHKGRLLISPNKSQLIKNKAGGGEWGAGPPGCRQLHVAPGAHLLGTGLPSSLLREPAPGSWVLGAVDCGLDVEWRTWELEASVAAWRMGCGLTRLVFGVD